MPNDNYFSRWERVIDAGDSSASRQTGSPTPGRDSSSAGALLRTFLQGWLEDDRFDVRVTADWVTHEWTGILDLVIKGTRI